MPYGFTRITSRLKEHGPMNEIVSLETTNQNIWHCLRKSITHCFHLCIRQLFISVLLKTRGLGVAVLCFRSIWNIAKFSGFIHAKGSACSCMVTATYCWMLIMSGIVLVALYCIFSFNPYNYSMRQILLSSSFYR